MAEVKGQVNPPPMHGTMIPSKIRGLHNFISDVRNADNKEAEAKRVNKEMANIRNKFKEKSNKNLSAYHRKKYVAKIMYMYMLGYEVDFGYIEAIRLLNADKFSEKQIGYLATQLMLTETHPMQPLIINSMQSDLSSRSDLVQCLSLTAIANIGSREMAEQVATTVLNMLLAQSTKLVAKKKAAACLLHLWRKNEECINWSDAVDRLVALCDPSIHIGFETALLALFCGLEEKMHDDLESAIPRLLAVLSKLTTSSGVPRDYLYYGTSAPWLQVRILRFLRKYPLPHDPTLRAQYLETISKILTSADSATAGSWNTKNSRNMVLFEAIDLAIDLDLNEEIIRQVTSLCCNFIEAKESNIRYHALEALAHLSTLSEKTPPALREKQDTVIAQLADPDISLRRRALDLLYCMCDRENSHHIVNELLQYVLTADYDIRGELVVKIAILAEKFAANYAWYVDIILQLVATAGDHVNDDIWHRVVRLVINHEDVQEYAARTVFRAVSHRTVHETTLKVGAYILGEFGHLIADNDGSRPLDQFHVFASKIGTMTTPTKALTLSTLDKFINLYPEETEMIRQIMFILDAHKSNIDAEIQQRAVEYVALATRPQLMAAVWDVMPLFPEEEQGNPTARKQTADGEDVPAPSTVHLQTTPSSPAAAAPVSPYSAAAAPPSPAGGAAVGSLLSSSLFDPVVPQVEVRTVLSPKNQEAFSRLCLTNEGVLYEDEFLQIGLRSIWQQSQGRVMLYFGNVTSQPLLQFSSNLVGVDGLAAQTQPAPETVAAGVQAQQALQLACLSNFTTTPTLNISFRAADRPNAVQLCLGLPAIVTKFFEPLTLDRDDFFSRWRQITTAPLDTMLVVKSNRPIDLAFVGKIFSTGFRLQVLENVDPNVNNLVGAATWHSQSKQVVVLVRLESNMQAQMYRLTVRTMDGALTTTVASLLQAQLGDLVPQ